MSAPAVPPHPGIKFPPPLVYVAGFLAGWLIGRRWPLAIFGADRAALRQVLAALCILVALSLILAAFTTFRRARTAIIPMFPASGVVTTGPYRVTRNPMYVSMLVLYVGIALIVNGWWPLIVLPLVVLLIDRAVIAREERYLRGAFPKEYAAYCDSVRRWI